MSRFVTADEIESVTAHEVINSIMPNYKEWTGHPTQKPEKLAERILLASSKPGDLVLIPFAGSGTEIEACIRTGRNWLAAEKEEQYIQEFILPRIQSVV